MANEDRTAGDRGQGGEALTDEEEARIQELEEEGILNREFISEPALKAIGALTDEQIRALKQINQKVDLNAFINPRGPQR